MTYNEFIQNIINTRGQWGTLDNSYWEGHHIIPRCLGGLGNARTIHENIIWLYPQEHYEAHKLLALEHPDNASLVFAWRAMSNLQVNNKQLQISAEDYAQLRLLDSQCKSIKYSGAGNPNYGKHCTEEQRQHFSNLYKQSLGVKNSPRFSGKHHTEESKILLSQNSIDRFWVNNGEIELFLAKDAAIPDNFILGRLSRLTKSKTVYCLELDLKFESIIAASHTLNIPRKAISECCCGRRSLAGGYHWEYI